MLCYDLFAWHVFATIGTYSYIFEVCTMDVNSCTTFFLFQMFFSQEEFDTHDPKAHHFFEVAISQKMVSNCGNWGCQGQYIFFHAL